MYDSRLGRWFTVDPLAQKYPMLSTYNFAGNSPITFLDDDGRDITVYGKDPILDKDVPILIIKTDLIVIDRYTQIPVPSMDVVINKPIEPYEIDLNTVTQNSDAFMIDLSLGVAPLGGANFQAVIINTGKDRGMYFYRPSAPTWKAGLMADFGFSTGGIFFHSKTQELSRFTFNGKSQGMSFAGGLTGASTVSAYENGEYCFSLFGEDCGNLLYSGGLVSVLGTSAKIGLSYDFSNSKIVDNWSIPFSESVISQLNSEPQNSSQTASNSTDDSNNQGADTSAPSRYDAPNNTRRPLSSFKKN